MAIDWDSLQPPPTDAERDDRRADIVARARTVARDGWDHYQYVWSTGEALAVALVLDSDDILADFGETRDSVLRRWAFDLFGHSGGAAEQAAGFPRTTAWFERARADVTA